MEINIKTPVKHDFRLIPVASEKMPPEYLKEDHDLPVLKDESGQIYEIVEYFDFDQGDVFPAALMLLATGMDIKAADAWRAYPRSKKLYMFLVKPLKD